MAATGDQPNDTLASRARNFGVILRTERYLECVAFYRDALGLPVWFEKDGLVCLRFGAGYLMVETGGVACDGRKPSAENPTVLRFNVDDVTSTAALLEERGIPVAVRQFSWGIVGMFEDPDGNACELKDAGDPFFAPPS